MSDRESCTHHFEHVKQTRPFTEREYMQCAKCGLHSPLGLFQHWDTERDGPAVKWPPRIDFARNSYAVRTSTPQHMLPTMPNIITPRQLGYTSKGKAIRPCRVWKSRMGIFKFFGLQWNWKCLLCNSQGSKQTWSLAYSAATRHAHNHH